MATRHPLTTALLWAAGAPRPGEYKDKEHGPDRQTPDLPITSRDPRLPETQRSTRIQKGLLLINGGHERVKDSDFSPPALHPAAGDSRLAFVERAEEFFPEEELDSAGDAVPEGNTGQTVHLRRREGRRRVRHVALGEPGGPEPREAEHGPGRRPAAQLPADAEGPSQRKRKPAVLPGPSGVEAGILLMEVCLKRLKTIPDWMFIILRAAMGREEVL